MAAAEMPADSLATAVASEDQGKALRALRDLLARQLDACDSGRDIAALATRLDAVLLRIADLPAKAKGTPLDELAARRGAGSGVAPRAVRGKQRTADRG